MKLCGVYRVQGKRDYRGHPPDTEFIALLEPRAEYRAVMRGSIEKLGTVVPQPQNFKLPHGWLNEEEL